MIYVIADDLTGATDTGVQFSKQGFKTIVLIAELLKNKQIKNIKKDNDVLVVDTETRDLSSSEARHKISNIIEDINILRDDLFYKKIDSTLRGNIGVEIDEIMKKLNKDLCILAPSFPSNNRIVSGGHLIVQDAPLGSTKYYTGKLNAGDASYLPYLLKKQTNLSIGKIDLKEVIKGKKVILNEVRKLANRDNKIIIIDAVNDKNLEDIVLGTRKYEGSLIYSGSAGLANYLPSIHNNKFSRYNIKNYKEKFLIVGGSRSDIVDLQVDFVKKKKEVCELKIDINDIFSSTQNILEKYMKKMQMEIKKRRYFVIRPDPMFKKKQIMKKLLEENNLNLREMEIIIRDFIGKLTNEIIKRYEIKNIIVTGGDTALGLCKFLGIDRLMIRDEILPGIPLSSGISRRYNQLNFVTKAGGFGNDKTLYELILKIEKFNKLNIFGGDKVIRKK